MTAPRCDGSGWIMRDGGKTYDECYCPACRPCEACGGKGARYLATGVGLLDEGPAHIVTEDCPRCGGTGVEP